MVLRTTAVHAGGASVLDAIKAMASDRSTACAVVDKKTGVFVGLATESDIVKVACRADQTRQPLHTVPISKALPTTKEWRVETLNEDTSDEYRRLATIMGVARCKHLPINAKQPDGSLRYVGFLDAVAAVKELRKKDKVGSADLLRQALSRLQSERIRDYVHSVPVGTTLIEAAARMLEKNIKALVVTPAGDEGSKTHRLMGIISMADIIRRGIYLNPEDWAGVSVEDEMTPADKVKTCSDSAVERLEAVDTMTNGGFRHMPLVEEERRGMGLTSFLSSWLGGGSSSSSGDDGRPKLQVVGMLEMGAILQALAATVRKEEKDKKKREAAEAAGKKHRGQRSPLPTPAPSASASFSMLSPSGGAIGSMWAFGMAKTPAPARKRGDDKGEEEEEADDAGFASPLPYDHGSHASAAEGKDKDDADAHSVATDTNPGHHDHHHDGGGDDYDEDEDFHDAGHRMRGDSTHTDASASTAHTGAGGAGRGRAGTDSSSIATSSTAGPVPVSSSSKRAIASHRVMFDEKDEDDRAFVGLITRAKTAAGKTSASEKVFFELSNRSNEIVAGLKAAFAKAQAATDATSGPPSRADALRELVFLTAVAEVSYAKVQLASASQTDSYVFALMAEAVDAGLRLLECCHRLHHAPAGCMFATEAAQDGALADVIQPGDVLVHKQPQPQAEDDINPAASLSASCFSVVDPVAFLARILEQAAIRFAGAADSAGRALLAVASADGEPEGKATVESDASANQAAEALCGAAPIFNAFAQSFSFTDGLPALTYLLTPQRLMMTGSKASGAVLYSAAPMKTLNNRALEAAQASKHCLNVVASALLLKLKPELSGVQAASLFELLCAAAHEVRGAVTATRTAADDESVAGRVRSSMRLCLQLPTAVEVYCRSFYEPLADILQVTKTLGGGTGSASSAPASSSARWLAVVRQTLASMPSQAQLAPEPAIHLSAAQCHSLVITSYFLTASPYLNAMLPLLARRPADISSAAEKALEALFTVAEPSKKSEREAMERALQDALLDIDSCAVKITCAAASMRASAGFSSAQRAAAAVYHSDLVVLAETAKVLVLAIGPLRQLSAVVKTAAKDLGAPDAAVAAGADEKEVAAANKKAGNVVGRAKVVQASLAGLSQRVTAAERTLAMLAGGHATAAGKGSRQDAAASELSLLPLTELVRSAQQSLADHMTK